MCRVRLVLRTRLSLALTWQTNAWWECQLPTNQKSRRLSMSRSLPVHASMSKMAENNFVPFPHFATNAIHEGQEPEQWNSMAVVPPISPSTTFKQFAPAEHAVRRLLCRVMFVFSLSLQYEFHVFCVLTVGFSA